MLKAKNKNVVDIIFNNKHAIKVYKGLQLVWQKIADFLHLTQVCGNSVQTSNMWNDSSIVIGYSLTAADGFLTFSEVDFYLEEYFEIQPNTDYVFYGLRENQLSRYNRIHFYDSNKTFISTGSFRRNNKGLGTSPSNAKYARLSCNPLNLNITIDDVKSFTWYFGVGNETTQDIPTPSNPIEIKSVGDKTKNLFNLNGDITLGYRLNTTTGIGKKYGTMGSTNDFITDGAYCVSELMEIKPNTNYAKNTPATAYYRIHFYDSDKICISVTNSSLTPSPANAKYMAICLPIAELGNNIQVEENSQVTQYEPYGYKLSVDVNGTISTCYLEQPLRKVGNEWDEIYKDDDGYHIERRIGVIPIDNTFTKGRFGTNRYRFVVSVPTMKAPSTYEERIALMISNNYASDSTPISWSESKKQYAISGFTNDTNIYLYNADLDNASSTSDDLNGDGYINYVLAESTFEDIEWDVEPLIHQGDEITFLTEIQPSDYTIE